MKGLEDYLNSYGPYVRVPVLQFGRHSTVLLPLSNALTLDHLERYVQMNSWVLDCRNLPRPVMGLPLDALGVAATLKWCTYEMFSGFCYLVNCNSGHAVHFLSNFAGTLSVPFYQVEATRIYAV